MARNFSNDLKRGQAGEALMLQLFSALRKTDGYRGDLLAPDGGKIELKTDSYGMHKTQNFFIERWSDVEKQKPGGPWQAAQHGCKYFVYYFSQNGVGWVWRLSDLMTALTPLESTFTPVSIQNKTWTTVGYKVERKLLLPASVGFVAYEGEVSNEANNSFVHNLGWGFKQLQRPG